MIDDFVALVDVDSNKILTLLEYEVIVMNSEKDLEQMLNANLYVDRFVNFEKTKMNLSNVERQLEAERYNKVQSYIAELDALL